MKCDRCGEQLPIVDGIDIYGQILCLECAMQGCDPLHATSADLSQNANISDNSVMKELRNITGCVR